MRRATPQQAFIHFHCRVSEKGLDPVPWRLEPGRVADCYLGLLLPPGPAGEPEAGTIVIVAPGRSAASSCSPAGRQPDLRAAHHPEREPGELVFAADLTGEFSGCRPGDRFP
jgi:hypothetical protein